MTAVAFALNVIGVFVILLGWLGVSGTARLSHQYGWSSLAVAGLAVAAFGNGLWLQSARRALGQRRRRLLKDRPAPLAQVVPTPQVALPDRASFVIAPGMTRYHRADCMLARGKKVRVHSVGKGAPTEPCGICRP